MIQQRHWCAGKLAVEEFVFSCDGLAGGADGQQRLQQFQQWDLQYKMKRSRMTSKVRIKLCHQCQVKYVSDK